VAAAAVAAVTAVAALAVSAPAAQVIKSGAGPGWPKTLSSGDFVRHVTNPYFPLRPGSRWRYEGRDGDENIVDRMRVTPRTKTILGVKTTVVHDQVLIHQRPREVTNDFYAQDRHGNVWYFGENTRQLDRHGNVTTREGSFLAGRDGARPGVFFPAKVRVGVSGRQEYYPGHALDHFKVIDHSKHKVRTKEWTPLEPNVVDNKYYARGIGTVRELAVKGPTERLHLVRFRRG
jgi:hypothetical protein